MTEPNLNKQNPPAQTAGALLQHVGMSADEALKLLFPDMSVLTQAERLRLASGGRIRGTMAGKRRSVSLGGSQEFADFRPYAPGDDVRRIDWNVYGRTGRAYVRQYWDEQELHAHLYVDASRSMSFTGGAACSKLQYALQLAALIGYAALVGEDRLTVKAFNESAIETELPVMHGRAAFPKLLQHLAALYAAPASARQAKDSRAKASQAAERSDLSAPFRQPGALPRRAGAAWLFTDAMFEDGMRESLLALTASGQQIVFVHLMSPEEINPSLDGELKLIDSELGTGKEVAISERLLREYRSAVSDYQVELKARCAEMGAAYAFLNTSQPLTQAIQTLTAVPGILKH